MARTWGRVLKTIDARPNVFDACLAAAVGAVGLLGIWNTTPTGSERSADLLGTLIVGAMALALAFRRHHALKVLAVVSALTIAFWVLDYPARFESTVMFALYAATAHGGDNRRRVWTVAALAIEVLAIVTIIGVLSPEEDLPAVAIAAVLVVNVTAAVIGQVVYDRRRRVAELEQRAVRAEAERELLARQAVLDERSRIARELHDVVAHGISVMVVQAGAAERLVDSNPARAQEALANIQGVGRESLGEMRRLLGVLRHDGDNDPAWLPQPSLDGLDELIDHANDAGVPTELIVTGQRPEPSIGAEMAVHRIVQEALTNVIRHAEQPSGARVLLHYTDHQIELEVLDDARRRPPRTDGRTNGESTAGHGLVGMRERVELYRGSFEAGPRTHGGFRVWATIPLKVDSTT